MHVSVCIILGQKELVSEIWGALPDSLRNNSGNCYSGSPAFSLPTLRFGAEGSIAVFERGCDGDIKGIGYSNGVKAELAPT